MFRNAIANQNHFLDCICCAMVEIAARHGESRRLNNRNENAAVADGNHAATSLATLAAFSVSPATFARTPMVDTIASLAVNPVIDAATGYHSPKPRGIKIGAIIPPMAARRLSVLSSTIPKLPSINPNPSRNHMITQARNRMVPALIIKPFSLPHT